MATFNASSTGLNLALMDDTFTYWIPAGTGLPALATLETPVTLPTTFIESDPAGLGIQAIWGGTGFTYAAPVSYYSGSSPAVVRFELTGGTAKTLSVLDAQNNTIYTLSGFSLALSATPRPAMADIFAGNDSILAGAGNDTLEGGTGNDSILAGAGNDTLDGGTGNDSIDGGLGDDLLHGGVGADSLLGGGGTDTVSYQTASAGVNLSLNTNGTGTAVIGAESDTLRTLENVLGTNHNDTLTGGTDTLNGASQHNLFRGLDGDDELSGGAGNDTLIGGLGADTIAGDAGNDTISFEDDIAVVIDLNATTHTVGGTVENHSGIENVIGGNANDSITGSTVANMLSGGNGNDTILGGAGPDTLVGGAGADNLAGGTGNDRLDGSTDGYYQSVADTLAGGIGNDYYVIENLYYYSTFDQVVENADEGTDTVELVTTTSANSSYVLAANVENLIVASSYYYYAATASGNALDNVITAKSAYSSYYYLTAGFKLYGGAGNDTITGSYGADTLAGGNGADMMVGGDGSDVYYVNAGGDVIQERVGPNYGNDTVVSSLNVTLANGLENATLLGVSTALNATGNASSNVLRGNQFNNSLSGLDGSDSLFGGAGADTLQGGLGNDTLNGGIGADIINGGDNTDTVDFSNLGVAITLNLGTVAAQNTGAGSDTITNIENANGGMVDDSLTGSAERNVLRGNAGNDTLVGLAGDDFLIGGVGNDVLRGGGDADLLSGDDGDDNLFGGAGQDSYKGGAGADIFYFDVMEAGWGEGEAVTDFVSGEDKLAIDMSAFGIGNGDTTINGGLMKFGPGGFGPGAELVIFTHGYSESSFPTTTAAAAAIGNASAAYGVGDKRLFVLDNSSSADLYLFTSAAADATVTAAELQLIGALQNTPNTTLGDYLFVA
ncbi:MAG: hypothetical protein CALGDGBN_01799 [Pseudomonadales bacterium]|nr:hypothetical protein [Pseudomonadales bacterium]